MGHQLCLQEAGYCYVHCGFTENELHAEICDSGLKSEADRSSQAWPAMLSKRGSWQAAALFQAVICATGDAVQELGRNGSTLPQPTT